MAKHLGTGWYLNVASPFMQWGDCRDPLRSLLLHWSRLQLPWSQLGGHHTNVPLHQRGMLTTGPWYGSHIWSLLMLMLVNILFKYSQHALNAYMVPDAKFWSLLWNAYALWTPTASIMITNYKMIVKLSMSKIDCGLTYWNSSHLPFWPFSVTYLKGPTHAQFNANTPGGQNNAKERTVQWRWSNADQHAQQRSHAQWAGIEVPY